MKLKDHQGCFNHWTKKYLSITYDKMNCSKFVEYVLRDHFGRDYIFPQGRGNLFEQSNQLKKHIPEFCIQTHTPKDGDLILMNGLRMLCHVGMYVKIQRTSYVFHSESSMGCAALHKIREIGNFGYSVAGYYTWEK